MRELRPNPRQHQFKPGDGAGTLDGRWLRKVFRLLAGAVDDGGLLSAGR